MSDMPTCSSERLRSLRVDYDRDGVRSCVDLIDIILAERAELEAAVREADRLRHDEAIEGDFVCPGDLRADAAEARVRELESTLSRAIFEHGEARYRDIAVTEARKLNERNDELRAEVERLRAALAFYGMHTDGDWGDTRCAKWVTAPSTDSGIDIDNSQPCTCGYDAALKEP